MMKRSVVLAGIVIILSACESLTPKSHHETGLNPEVQGHINRQKGEDIGEITDSIFDIADVLLR